MRFNSRCYILGKILLSLILLKTNSCWRPNLTNQKSLFFGSFYWSTELPFHLCYQIDHLIIFEQHFDPDKLFPRAAAFIREKNWVHLEEILCGLNFCGSTLRVSSWAQLTARVHPLVNYFGQNAPNLILLIIGSIKWSGYVDLDTASVLHPFSAIVITVGCYHSWQTASKISHVPVHA